MGDRGRLAIIGGDREQRAIRMAGEAALRIKRWAGQEF